MSFDRNRLSSRTLLFARVAIAAGLVVLAGACQSPSPKTTDPKTSQQNSQTIQAAREARLAALETRRELLVRTRVPEQRRLWRLAYPLLRAGAGLCVEETVPALGFDFWNRYSLGKPMSEALGRSYAQDDALRVFALAPDGPAVRAGLEIGDELLALGNEPIPVGVDAPRAFALQLAADLKEAQATQLKIRRGDQEQILVMVPEPICSFEVRYSPSNRVGAASNGSIIVVGQGLMVAAVTDEALALVIAREIGHNILNHAGARKAYLFLGGLVDMLAATQGIATQGAFQAMAAGVKAAEFEVEADYVGLYLMARAAIAVKDAPEQWQRLVKRLPPQNGYVDQDPSVVAVRTIAMRQTVREIREKQDTGAPLLPDLKTSDDYPVRNETLSNR